MKEIALKQRYHPPDTPWGVGNETGLLLSHSWVNHYYYCCKISMVTGSFLLVLFLISVSCGLNEQYNMVMNRTSTKGADGVPLVRAGRFAPGVPGSAELWSERSGSCVGSSRRYTLPTPEIWNPFSKKESLEHFKSNPLSVCAFWHLPCEVRLFIVIFLWQLLSSPTFNTSALSKLPFHLALLYVKAVADPHSWIGSARLADITYGSLPNLVCPAE